MGSLYTNFTDKLIRLPLWVKEILYNLLKKNLQETLPYSDINTDEENLYQYFHPKMTYTGKKEYERMKYESLDSDEFKFLNALTRNESIIEITLNNAWTLEETSQTFYRCIDMQLAAIPESDIIAAKAAYFANKIRIGEYFKRIGLINAEQLEQAMRIQKESALANERKGFASILIDLNLITRNDTDEILTVKQESKQRYILNFNNDSNPNDQNVRALAAAEKQIEKLSYENKILKAKLRKVMNLD